MPSKRDGDQLGWPSLAAVRRTGAALGHEPLELLAVLGAADRLDIFGEFALRVVELAALLVEPGELGRPPLVERHVAGRGAA